MSTETQPTKKPVPENIGAEQMSCELCLSEVPASGAKSEETSDYVAHFCGVECYDQWRKEQDD